MSYLTGTGQTPPKGRVVYKDKILSVKAIREEAQGDDVINDTSENAEQLLSEVRRTEPRRFWRMTEDQLKQYRRMKDDRGVYLADIDIRYSRWDLMGIPVYVDDHHKGKPEINVIIPDDTRCLGDSDWVEFDPDKMRRLSK